MAEEFLTAEVKAPAPKAAKKTRKRGPMSEEQKAKIRASNLATRERKAAEAKPQVPNVKTGVTADQAEEMKRELALKAAEAKIKAEAISEDNRLMVHQEIRVDVFNLKRQFVELTPSMCRSKNCPFDAAREAGATSWGDAPINQPMSDGKTFGDRLIELRDYHEATAHTVQQTDSHIMTAAEVNKRQWNPGQSIKNEFLTGAK
jgi:hypothetical protein